MTTEEEVNKRERKIRNTENYDVDKMANSHWCSYDRNVDENENTGECMRVEGKDTRLLNFWVEIDQPVC